MRDVNKTNSIKKLGIFLFSTKGMNTSMVLLFLVALFLTLHDIHQKQVTNTRASNPKNMAPLSQLPHVKVHHPIQEIQSNKKIGKKLSPAALSASFGYKPDDIKHAYNIPSTGGSGTIAIVDSFDSPTAENELNIFSSQFNLPSCTTANGCFKKVNQQGGNSYPHADASWAQEIDLDIEWAHAIAPNAKILLIEVNSDTNLQDLVAGIDYARNQSGVVAVSLSWGAPEFSQESSYDGYFTSTGNTAFFAASGDTGHGTMWPSVSPNVIAVGGTSLVIGTTTITETGWNKSGGGLSSFEPVPGYQTSFGVPNTQGKRAIPDVSMTADPNSGALMFAVDGWHLVGGTSLSTPIWAGMSALGRIPFSNTLLYQNAKTNYGKYYRDITSGTNGTCGTYCKATQSYDYVTGLGSPIGFFALNPTPTPTRTPTVTPSPTPGSNTFTISAMQFTPHFYNIPAGTTVTWVNHDTIPHTTTSDVQGNNLSWDSGPLLPGQSFSKTFTTPGTYLFHCSIHPSMTGYVEVFGNISPTPTGNPSGTNLSLTIGLHDIGNTGDNVTPIGKGNPNPNHPVRPVTISIFDLQNIQKQQIQGSITFDNPSGLFKGPISLGNLPTGDYQLKIKSDGFLVKRLPQIIHITANQTTQIPLVTLVNGDIDNNNQLDILDYNILASCFGSKQNTSLCTAPSTLKSAGADLDDSKIIDGVDYNIFIREMSVQSGN